MDSIQDILNELKAFRGTDQQEPLEISTRNCSKCGQEFRGFSDCCRTCLEAEALAERRAAAEERLAEAITSTRAYWKTTVANLPKLFAGKSFDDFDAKMQPKAFKAVSTYDYGAAQSLVLLSPDLYGVGKTHLVVALANRILDAHPPAILKDGLWLRYYHCPAYFTTESALLARIRATYNRTNGDEQETEENVYDDLEQFRLLIIDDVGKVRPKDYSFLQGVYFRIIDTRYTQEQPIILTTNLGFEDLEAHIGGACADRLREMCGKNFIVMKGQSYRR